eukprot:s878_g1.t1
MITSGIWVAYFHTKPISLETWLDDHSVADHHHRPAAFVLEKALIGWLPAGKSGFIQVVFNAKRGPAWRKDWLASWSFKTSTPKTCSESL